jgi:hypothetical protein
MGANKTYQQKGDRGCLLGESDEFKRLRRAVGKAHGDRERWTHCLEQSGVPWSRCSTSRAHRFAAYRITALRRQLSGQFS